MDKQLLVSIILPTYNGSSYIKQSIDSCLGQTYKNFELIIVDDCSSDETVNIIKSYSDPRIKYFKHERNLGLPRALNTGFENAKGEYLTWTSDDNFFHVDAIAKMVSILEKNKDIGFVYANFYLIDEKGKIFKSYRVGSSKSLDRGNLIGACFLYRREVYEKIGEYIPEFRLAEDYNYWLRIRQSFKMKKINDFLYYYRRHQKSLTWSNKLVENVEQMEKASNDYIPVSMRYYHKGQVFFYQKKYQESKKLLIKALAVNPFDLLVWRFFLFVILKILFPRIVDKIKKTRD